HLRRLGLVAGAGLERGHDPVPLGVAGGWRVGRLLWLLRAEEKMTRTDLVPLAQDGRPLHYRAPLAHLARPAVAHEHGHRRGADLRRLAAGRDRVGEEGRGQARYGVAPLAQRQHVQRDAVHAEEEVLAELAARDLVAEVAVRRRDEADVEVDRLDAADAVDGPGLEHAQDLGLEPGRRLADLVEEDGAAGGDLEQAGLGRDRAREGAALVAEELALEQRLAEAGAVDGDELPAPTRARVERARQHLLARAGL